MRDMILQAGRNEAHNQVGPGVNLESLVTGIAAAKDMGAGLRLKRRQVSNAAKSAGNAARSSIRLNRTGFVQTAKAARDGDEVTKPTGDAQECAGRRAIHFKFSKRSGDHKGSLSRGGGENLRPGDGGAA